MNRWCNKTLIKEFISNKETSEITVLGLIT